MTDTTEKASETKVAEVVSPVGKKPMPREIGAGHLVACHLA